MKTALYLVVLVVGGLLLPSVSQADSFTISSDNSNQFNLTSFSMSNSKNQFTLQVSLTNQLGSLLFADYLLGGNLPTLWVNDYATVNGKPTLVETYEFDGNTLTKFALGLLDTATITYQKDSIVGPSSGAPEPGSLLLLGSGLVGLAGLRKRRMLSS